MPNIIRHSCQGSCAHRGDIRSITPGRAVTFAGRRTTGPSRWPRRDPAAASRLFPLFPLVSSASPSKGWFELRPRRATNTDPGRRALVSGTRLAAGCESSLLTHRFGWRDSTSTERRPRSGVFAGATGLYGKIWGYSVAEHGTVTE